MSSYNFTSLVIIVNVCFVNRFYAESFVSTVFTCSVSVFSSLAFHGNLEIS